MKHFTNFIKPGTKRILTKGNWISNSLVFENLHGEIVVIVGNAMNNYREFSFKHGEVSFSTIIKVYFFNTFCIDN